MYCRKCGKQISDEVKYCPYCGANQKNGGVSVSGILSHMPFQAFGAAHNHSEGAMQYPLTTSSYDSGVQEDVSSGEQFYSYGEPYEENFDKYNTHQYGTVRRGGVMENILDLFRRGALGAVGGIMMFIAAFLPFISASESFTGFRLSYNYFNCPAELIGESYILIVAFGIIQIVYAVTITLCSALQKKIPTIVLSVFGIIHGIISIIVCFAATTSLYSFSIKVGAGPVFTIIGAIAALAGGIFIERKKKAPAYPNNYYYN